MLKNQTNWLFTKSVGLDFSDAKKDSSRGRAEDFNSETLEYKSRALTRQSSPSG